MDDSCLRLNWRSRKYQHLPGVDHIHTLFCVCGCSTLCGCGNAVVEGHRPTLSRIHRSDICVMTTLRNNPNLTTLISQNAMVLQRVDISSRTRYCRKNRGCGFSGRRDWQRAERGVDCVRESSVPEMVISWVFSIGQRSDMVWLSSIPATTHSPWQSAECFIHRESSRKCHAPLGTDTHS